MPVYLVTASEKVVLRTTYLVEAASQEEAVAKCRDGTVEPVSEEPEDAEWLALRKVEEVDGAAAPHGQA